MDEYWLLIDGEPVAHVAVCPFFQSGYYRATRLVVMPEWQGAGIGTRFLDKEKRYVQMTYTQRDF